MRRPMAIRVGVRFMLIAALCCAAAFAAGTPAQATTEYCPARAYVQPVGVDIPANQGTPSASMYSVVLSAPSSRSVSGTLSIHADDAWYSVAFSNVELSAYSEQWQDAYVTFTRPAFLSNVLYVQFPAPVVVRSAFVSQARAQDELVYGWDAKGQVTCAGEKDLSVISTDRNGQYSDRSNRADLKWLNPVPADNASPGPGIRLTPALTSAPGSTDCATPFADAVVSHAVSPAFPYVARGLSSETFVEVAIAADGKLDEAWVWAPSGNKWLDQAALEAANQSKYLPARAFCENVPGTYIFRAVFRSP
jgi:TonB family protein